MLNRSRQLVSALISRFQGTLALLAFVGLLLWGPITNGLLLFRPLEAAPPIEVPVGHLIESALLWLVFYMLLAVFILYRTREAPALGFLLFSILSICIMSSYILGYANVFRRAGLIEPGGQVIHRPLDELYFSVITWTTTGYGDLRPLPNSRLLAASEALTGYVFMALFLGIIISQLVSGRSE
jgi:hypothetical protein